MADVIEASAFVVQIVAAWVSVPAEVAMQMDIGMAPCTEGTPMIQKQDVSGRSAHDS